MAGFHEALSSAAREHGERCAVRAGDRAWTFDEIERWSGRAAGELAAVGVGPGERVALRTANRVELVVAAHAIARLGASSVLLSPAWKAAEIDHALALTGARSAVVDSVDGGLLADRLGASAVLDVDVRPLGTGPGPTAGAPAPVVADDDEAVLVFSSGTTGLPKAVRHTHGSLRAATEHWRSSLGLGPDDRFQVSTPPSHILGLLNLLAAIDAGAWVRLNRRFDLVEELRWIASERMTLEMAVAPIALAMVELEDLESYDLSSLRFVMWCATPVTAPVAEALTERTGVPVMTAYGASEVPVLTSSPVADPGSWRLESVGTPPEGVELRVVSLGDGDPLPPGGVGEIQARSPSTMAGYLPAEADADAFQDGWYRTGDVGRIDGTGWVEITDRVKEMIKVNGFQVAPAELESVLLAHTSVLDCAVFGVPDDRTGEAPVAAVRVDPARPVDPVELQQLVADTMATYKRLRRVVVVDEVPRLPSGKALRRELRDRWLAGELSG